MTPGFSLSMGLRAGGNSQLATMYTVAESLSVEMYMVIIILPAGVGCSCFWTAGSVGILTSNSPPGALKTFHSSARRADGGKDRAVSPGAADRKRLVTAGLPGWG